MVDDVRGRTRKYMSVEHETKYEIMMYLSKRFKEGGSDELGNLFSSSMFISEYHVVVFTKRLLRPVSTLGFFEVAG